MADVSDDILYTHFYVDGDAYRYVITTKLPDTSCSTFLPQGCLPKVM
jgi:hypothetical protein